MTITIIDLTKIDGYYTFEESDYHQSIEGRFWNQDGKQLAIVACISKGVDWAAYIGTDAPNSQDEDSTLNYVAKWGCKLSEKDARHFFPSISLPYRQ